MAHPHTPKHAAYPMLQSQYTTWPLDPNSRFPDALHGFSRFTRTPIVRPLSQGSPQVAGSATRTTAQEHQGPPCTRTRGTAPLPHCAACLYCTVRQRAHKFIVSVHAWPCRICQHVVVPWSSCRCFYTSSRVAIASSTCGYPCRMALHVAYTWPCRIRRYHAGKLQWHPNQVTLSLTAMQPDSLHVALPYLPAVPASTRRSMVSHRTDPASATCGPSVQPVHGTPPKRPCPLTCVPAPLHVSLPPYMCPCRICLSTSSASSCPGSRLTPRLKME